VRIRLIHRWSSRRWAGLRALAEWADYWMPEDSDDWTVSSKAEREATQRTARVARRNGG